MEGRGACPHGSPADDLELAAFARSPSGRSSAPRSRLRSPGAPACSGSRCSSATGAGPGLLIPDCRSVHTFGMRFDLDLLFLDGNGRVTELRRSVPPFRFVRCRAAAAVLELPSP